MSDEWPDKALEIVEKRVEKEVQEDDTLDLFHRDDDPLILSESRIDVPTSYRDFQVHSDGVVTTKLVSAAKGEGNGSRQDYTIEISQWSWVVIEIWGSLRTGSFFEEDNWKGYDVYLKPENVV